VGDINRDYYRTKKEETDWKRNRDPITNFGKWLQQQKIATADELVAINAEIKVQAEEAVAYAEQAPYPDTSEVDMHVFAPNSA
ncbi:MAG: ABC transporter substrate-binding protein, partial [bacterium]|nr:ABC transporter substrate-binding protein [bacterium]